MSKTDYIKNEYYRAQVHYEAMKALAEKEGIDIDGGVTPEPEPIPTPTPEPTPEPAPEKKDPAIVYTGPTEYVLKIGESAKFDVYANNIASTKDYTIEPYGNPNYYKYSEKTYITESGFRLAFEITGANVGSGKIKVYITKNKRECVIINIKVKE